MRGDDLIHGLKARHAALAARIEELSAACAEARADSRLLDSTVDRLRSVAGAIEGDFAACVREESQRVFPGILAAVPAAGGSIHPLLDDHVELTEMIARLLATVDEPRSGERDEQIVVQVRDIVDLFRIHMRKEESVVYRLRDQILPRGGTNGDVPQHETKGWVV